LIVFFLPALSFLLHSIFFFFSLYSSSDLFTLSLHDALPISSVPSSSTWDGASTPASTSRSTPRPTSRAFAPTCSTWSESPARRRSEEHTSELQSRFDLVCRLLLEKKKDI